jgi:hypothetical protein
MAAASPKPAEGKTPRARKGASVRLAEGLEEATASPALRQLDILHEQWAEAERHASEPAKWSRRRTLIFIALTCGGFWAALIVGASRLVH